ncbi:YIP1 family protein [Sporosarcina sp. HYO08]|uniref:YIP1 family protein n=1 Tax=Sporosarcina sp. HYO08 TaxID=1759557 RepID=UPI000792BC58|nr:YIP1 family protein [Sporosarcina sp. HYO08]KXH84036.1 hypothetical protein AU377_04590 [Sporosarcina sp. HYO08]
MNPFLSIWKHPSQTIQYIVDHKTIPYALMLIAFSSLASSFMGFADSGFFEQFPFPLILFLVLFLSLLIGTAGFGLTVVAYTWIGKLLGGSGKMRQMGLAVAAGTIPTIWTAPIGIIALFLYGEQLFATPTNPFGITNMSIGFYILNAVIMMGISIFSIVVQSKAIGIVHQFSAWRGFGTLLIFAGIVIFLLLLVVASILAIII